MIAKRKGIAAMRDLKEAWSQDLAIRTAGGAHGPWRLANRPALAIALPIAYCDSPGIPRLTAG